MFRILCNPGIFRTLIYLEPTKFRTKYAEPWHIQNPGIFRILTYLEPEKYSEPLVYLKSCKVSTVERFAKKVLYTLWNVVIFFNTDQKYLLCVKDMENKMARGRKSLYTLQNCFDLMLICSFCFCKISLTHLFPIHPFSTPWKHQRAVKMDSGEKGLLISLIPSKHFDVGSMLFLGWYDVATSHNAKSTLKQHYVRQRWNLQRWTTLKQRCVFQRWIEQC